MAIEKVPMTLNGFVKIEEEYKQLKSVERPAIIQAIADARAHGDLSENAEYHSAKEKQGFIEGRIKELEGKISCANVIDPTKIESETVMFSATITIVDEDTDKEFTYQIVGDDEADIAKGLLSYTSPMAKAMLGKKVGDSFELITPNGERFYEILEIKYI